MGLRVYMTSSHLTHTMNDFNMKPMLFPQFQQIKFKKKRYMEKKNKLHNVYNYLHEETRTIANTRKLNYLKKTAEQWIDFADNR